MADRQQGGAEGLRPALLLAGGAYNICIYVSCQGQGLVVGVFFLRRGPGGDSVAFIPHYVGLLTVN